MVLKYVIHSYEYIILFHIPLSMFFTKLKDQTSQIFSFILLFATSKTSTYATLYPVHVSTQNTSYKSDSFLFRDHVYRYRILSGSRILFRSRIWVFLSIFSLIRSKCSGLGVISNIIISHDIYIISYYIFFVVIYMCYSFNIYYLL